MCYSGPIFIIYFFLDYPLTARMSIARFPILLLYYYVLFQVCKYLQYLFRLPSLSTYTLIAVIKPHELTSSL